MNSKSNESLRQLAQAKNTSSEGNPNSCRLGFKTIEVLKQSREIYQPHTLSLNFSLPSLSSNPNQACNGNVFLLVSLPLRNLLWITCDFLLQKNFPRTNLNARVLFLVNQEANCHIGISKRQLRPLPKLIYGSRLRSSFFFFQHLTLNQDYRLKCCHW